MSVNGTRNATRISPSTSAVVSSQRTRTTAPKIAPVAASTIGYRGEIAARQSRQRPRSTTHETTGTLSYGRIGWSQTGQCDGGFDSDSPRGTR